MQRFRPCRLPEPDARADDVARADGVARADDRAGAEPSSRSASSGDGMGTTSGAPSARPSTLTWTSAPLRYFCACVTASSRQRGA